MDWRARAALNLLRGKELERLLARARRRGDRSFPRADLRRRRGRPEPAPAPVVGVDPLPFAKGAELVDGLGRDPHQTEGLLLPRALDQRLDLRPPGEREPAVAAGWPAAADVGLEEDDRGPRLELVQAERSPEARVPAADDADVGTDGLEELRGLDAVLGRKRLAEPERAGGHPRSLDHGFGGTVGGTDPLRGRAGDRKPHPERRALTLVARDLDRALRGRGRWRPRSSGQGRCPRSRAPGRSKRGRSGRRGDAARRPGFRCRCRRRRGRDPRRPRRERRRRARRPR